MMNILLVEDDLDLAATVVDFFELESVTCDHAANGVAGLNLIQQHHYDAIILDINMPKMNGLSVCAAMRSEGIDTPVLMLTARDTLEEKLEGFASGTDDYLVKPFELEELLVRIKALAKRRSGQVDKLRIADLEIDTRQKQAKRGGEFLKLSPTGFKILETLARQSPAPVSREKLMQVVWGDNIPDSNSLKVHLYNLRKQLDQDNNSTLIHTVGSQGFALRPPPE
ncbi:Response regulator MprA [Zhongshania aliphaticivorans]|uniref:Response regulator MprA n=1 Tax=Zhongshania aliphaticivorans TaxID=1470434 RepID=A0A5S9N6Y9_9GAMM|nr:response regulator transcription factor [Zhongshania aliphaticivorans]CAA0080547.1 Response regulator MprA [Zhongshania aliphaticivorans]CAA0085593.1 Response regulator MprA [Zhongshania aliphaticivorans]